jgi:phosphate transport system permease protein
MATEPDTADAIRRDTWLRFSKLKEVAFEGLLIGATLVGIVALVVLFGYMFVDAIGPLAASARWYLIFFGTLVAPTSAFALYARRRPAVRLMNARAFAAVFGGLAVSLAAWVVFEATGPHGLLLYVLLASVAPLVIAGYGSYVERSMFVGPAIVLTPVAAVLWTLGTEVIVFALFDLIALLFGAVPVLGSLQLPVGVPNLVTAVAIGGPTLAVLWYLLRRQVSPRTYVLVPVVAALSGLGTAGFDYWFQPTVDVLADWIAFLGLVGVPAAAFVGVAVKRRSTGRRSLAAGGAVIAGNLLIGGIALGAGVDPSFWIVLFSAGVVPIVYVAFDAVVRNREGKVGLAGPFVLVGGVVLGAFIEDVVDATGPDTWLTPTLLVNSWNGLEPARAGAYPSIVGSIMIVSIMALMSFPVGVGAAIYLEEYAPNTGWAGRFANFIEINIANLAGVPSVVYGLLGLALFNNTLDFPPGIVLSAGATLGLLILPIVIVSAQEAIRAVPDALRQGSYGMGASRWQTLRNVVLPEAIPGILTGTILALGRAIGETAPLIVISVPVFGGTPSGLFSSGAALPLRIFAASANAIPAYRKGVLAALAVVLLVLMLTMNAVAILLRNRYQGADPGFH